MEMKLCLFILPLCLGIRDTLGTSIGSKVAAWTPASKINPDELANDIRGEKILSDEYGFKISASPWPDNKIPYMITGSFYIPDYQLIHQAMDDFHHTTCVRFVPRTDEPIYVNITSHDDGCYSSQGYVGTSYDVNLQNPGCVYRGVVLHELAHAIGLYHEQSRKDRDNYVKINWENIEEDTAYNFQITSYDLYEQPYNYASVMHYSAYVFSKNGLPTLEPKGHENVILGQRQRLSQGDIRNINHMYKCAPQPLSRKKTRHVRKIVKNRKKKPSGKQVPSGITYNRNDYNIIIFPNGQELWYPKIDVNAMSEITYYGMINPFSGYTNTGFYTGSAGTYTSDTQYPNLEYYTQNSYGPQYAYYGYYPQNTYVPNYPNSRYYPQYLDNIQRSLQDSS